jgi:hypothetical protein
VSVASDSGERTRPRVLIAAPRRNALGTESSRLAKAFGVASTRAAHSAVAQGRLCAPQTTDEPAGSMTAKSGRVPDSHDRAGAFFRRGEFVRVAGSPNGYSIERKLDTRRIDHLTIVPGSTRDSRVGFGDSPKRTCLGAGRLLSLPAVAGESFPQSDRTRSSNLGLSKLVSDRKRRAAVIRLLSGGSLQGERIRPNYYAFNYRIIRPTPR